MNSIFRGALCASLLLATPSLAREPAPLSAYGDLPGVEMMAIAPSGHRIAAISQVRQERLLLIIENGKATSNTPVSDLKIRGLDWAGDDFLVVSKSDTVGLPFGFTANKVELSSGTLLRFDGEKPENIFGNIPSMSAAIFGFYGIRQVGGKWFGYYSGLKYALSADRTTWEFDHNRPTLFAVDLSENKPRIAARAAGENHWRDWLVDEKGQVAASLDMTENGSWSLENASSTKLAQGSNPNGDVSLRSFGKTTDSVIYSYEDKQAGAKRYFEVPLAGGSATEQFADVDIDSFFVSGTDGTLLGYLTYDGAKPKPVFFDAKRQATVDKVFRAFPTSDVTFVDATPDYSKLIVLTRGNGDSGTYFVVDMARMKADAIGYERPSIFPEQVGPISTIDYKASDGLELDGILTLPPGREAKNLPVIMFPHGGPSAHDYETFDWWAQAFASRGYAVFQPNFRGSTNRDIAFRDAGHGQWGRKMQTDISDGLAELVKQGIADPKRACIMGASYGGYAALAGVTLQNGIYRCAVAVAPVSDLRDMYWSNYSESGKSKMLRLNYLQELGDPAKFVEVSPRKHAVNADAPILLVHGKDDTVVAFNQSSRMADALRDAGKPHEFVVMVEEDHWLSKGATRKQMLEEAMRFMQKHNPAD